MPGSSPGMTRWSSEAWHGPGSGEAKRDRQGRAPPPPVSLPLLCGELPRPGERRVRRARHEPGPRPHTVDLRRRRRHLLHRLSPVRDPEQSCAAEIRRAHLDRAHHDQLGTGCFGHGLGERHDRLLPHALSAGRGGGGVLPGHHPLSHLLVPGAGAGPHRLAVHGGGAARHRGGRPGVGRAARAARGRRSERLALALHRRRPAGGAARLRRPQIPRRSPSSSGLAHTR